ncbi:hypothetical protein G9A89_009093 [Geosiphon pyriformis]|nr:hypothetical protein G9A89_009093 [Geosiphon pyriformis]
MPKMSVAHAFFTRDHPPEPIRATLHHHKSTDKLETKSQNFERSFSVFYILSSTISQETNPFVVDPAATMSGLSVKKRSTRVSTTGLIGGDLGHKIKKPPGGAKLSSGNTTLESGGSGHVVRQFNDIDTDGKASEVAVKKSFALDINLSAVEGKLAMAKTQKAVVEFAKSSQADQLAAKWLFLIGKDSVHVVKAVRDCETWTSRDWYKTLLVTLPVGTMAYDLGNLLAEAVRKTCVINWSLDTGNRVRCVVVCFENDKVLESAFHTEPIFGGVKLSWTKLDLVWCEQCEKLGHSVLECDTEISASTKLSKSFKKVVSDENRL